MYIRMLICLAAIAILAAPSCAAPTPFVIGGWIFYENDTACYNPAVQATNATSVSWDAENSSASNYCQIVLDSDDVSDGGTLQFDAAGCSQSNTPSHAVSQAEIDAGGFELNITLEGSGVLEPVITSCNDTGAEQNEFYPGENVSVTGTGLAPNTEYTIWIQDDPVSEGNSLPTSVDPSGSQETVTTDADGSFGPTTIWSTIPAIPQKNYDIVVDNQDDVYNAADDGIDSSNGVVGIVAPIPELATFALIGVGLMLVVGLIRFRRRER